MADNLTLPCPECDGSGHDNTKFCPATAWAAEGMKAGDPGARCHPCPACSGRGVILNPEAVERAAKGLQSAYAAEGHRRGYAVVIRPWEREGPDARSWWMVQAGAALRAALGWDQP